MERLNYDVLKKSGYDGYVLKDAPEKVLQFGEGNFLRAFVDYWFDLANEKAGWNGKCCLVQPIAPGLAKMINEQEGLYTLYLRGSENGQNTLVKILFCMARLSQPLKAGHSFTSNLYPTPHTVFSRHWSLTPSSFSRRRLMCTSTVRLSPQ